MVEPLCPGLMHSRRCFVAGVVECGLTERGCAAGYSAVVFGLSGQAPFASIWSCGSVSLACRGCARAMAPARRLCPGRA
jgi:hypothetical protein